MGRGDVLITNTFQVDNAKEYRFHFTATHAMVPVTHLIVYYVRQDGELIADALDIEIDGLLQNFVSNKQTNKQAKAIIFNCDQLQIDIQVNTVESEPDLDVEMIIRAQQNSYIGLLAVDENVGLLKPGYDLTHKEIAEELLRYDVAKGTPYSFISKDAKTHFMWKPGESNAHTAIYVRGLII